MQDGAANRRDKRVKPEKADAFAVAARPGTYAGARIAPFMTCPGGRFA